eukprot:76709-Amphidinium_carterae.2
MNHTDLQLFFKKFVKGYEPGDDKVARQKCSHITQHTGHCCDLHVKLSLMLNSPLTFVSTASQVLCLGMGTLVIFVVAFLGVVAHCEPTTLSRRGAK